MVLRLESGDILFPPGEVVLLPVGKAVEGENYRNAAEPEGRNGGTHDEEGKGLSYIVGLH